MTYASHQNSGVMSTDSSPPLKCHFILYFTFLLPFPSMVCCVWCAFSYTLLHFIHHHFDSFFFFFVIFFNVSISRIQIACVLPTNKGSVKQPTPRERERGEESYSGLSPLSVFPSFLPFSSVFLPLVSLSSSSFLHTSVPPSIFVSPKLLWGNEFKSFGGRSEKHEEERLKQNESPQTLSGEQLPFLASYLSFLPFFFFFSSFATETQHPLSPYPGRSAAQGFTVLASDKSLTLPLPSPLRKGPRAAMKSLPFIFVLVFITLSSTALAGRWVVDPPARRHAALASAEVDGVEHLYFFGGTDAGSTASSSMMVHHFAFSCHSNPSVPIF